MTWASIASKSATPVSSSPSSPSSERSSERSSAASVEELSNKLAVASIGEPAKSMVYIAIDLEAITHAHNSRYGNPAGKIFPIGTPSEIGISILRATPKNLDLFAKNPNSRVGTSFRHIKVKEFKNFRSRIRNLQSGPFHYGETEFVALAHVNGLLRKIVEEESKHGQVVLVGHAIQNDQRFLANGRISAFDNLFDRAVDVQELHREGHNVHRLSRLVQGYDETNPVDWEHNAGNDAKWTLWVMARYLKSTDNMDPNSSRSSTCVSQLSRSCKRLGDDYDNDGNYVGDGTWDL